MKKRMHWLLLATLSGLSVGAVAQERQVPHQFEPNTPAVAADVNQNFNYLADEISGLEQQLTQAEYVSEPLDCNADPYILNKVYNQVKHYREINLYITGTCYGSINLMRDDNGDYVVTPDGYINNYQVMGQTLHISSVDETQAALIPHPETGAVDLFAGFAGGLYLRNLDIELGTGDGVGILFSRNSHGDLSSVNISPADGATIGRAIQLQEGSQLYLFGVSIEGVAEGIHVINGGLLRILDDVTVKASQRGLTVNAGRVRAFGEFRVNRASEAPTDYAVKLTNGATYAGDYSELLLGSGALIVEEQSVLDNYNVRAGRVNVSAASAMIANIVSDNLVVKDTANVVVNSGSINEAARTLSNAALTLYEVTVPTIDVRTGAELSGSPVINNQLHVQRNAMVTLFGGSVGGEMFIGDSNFSFDGTAINSPAVDIWNSQGELKNLTSVDYSRFYCNGLTSVEVAGVDWLTDYPGSNCMGTHDFSKLLDLIKN